MAILHATAHGGSGSPMASAMRVSGSRSLFLARARTDLLTCIHLQSMLRQLFNFARRGNPKFLAVLLVIPLHVAEAIDIVHHQAGRALQAAWRRVAEPVHPLQTRPVSQMESRHRIERFLSSLRAQQVIRA